MRKYLLNAGVLSAIAGAVGVAKATQESPKDWRTYMLWASWGIGVALAIGAVVQKDRQVRLEELERELSQ